MRDVDINFTTHFVTPSTSGIRTVQDLKGKRVALGSRGSAQTGMLAYYFLQQMGLDPTGIWRCVLSTTSALRAAGSDEQDVVERVCRGEYRGRCGDAADTRRLTSRRQACTRQPADGLVQSRLQSLLLHGAQRYGCRTGAADYPDVCQHQCR